MTDEQRLERERGNIRDGYASLHSAQLGAQFLLAQLDTARQQLKVAEDSRDIFHLQRDNLANQRAAAEQREAQLRQQCADLDQELEAHATERMNQRKREAQLREALMRAQEIVKSANTTPEWLQYARTARTDEAVAIIDAVLATKES